MPCSDPAFVSDPRPAFKLAVVQRFPGASQVILAGGHATISALLKSRFRRFHVNELMLDDWLPTGQMAAAG